jgi:hypothetical protein
MAHISGVDILNVGFQILTVDVMNCFIFRDMSYSLLKISRRFREHFAAKLAA